MRAALQALLQVFVFVVVTALVSACAGVSATTAHRTGPVRLNARWVVLPVENHSETPQAGERVEAMLETLLRRGGVGALDKYPPQKEDDTHLLTSDRQRYELALEWARGAKYDYAVTGSVEEWRYKSGLDGEPAVGVSMRVLELATGKVMWVGTGSRTGGSADNTSFTAMKLLDDMVRDFAPAAP
jgi:polysaccharide biosynthesis protein PelC